MLKFSQAPPPPGDDDEDQNDVIRPHNDRFLEKVREIPSSFLLTLFLQEKADADLQPVYIQSSLHLLILELV